MQALEKLVRHNDVLAYLTMMTIRLIELRRVLKPTGSIYLHCDPTASHYLKIVMDVVFGKNNFRNEVVWFYKTGGVSKRWFAKKHDIILFYTKTDDYHFNPQKEKSYLSHKYGFSNIEIKQDDEGYYTEVGMRDVWDIPALRGNQPETLGYPTQKPEALLERIIKVSSWENDYVLDPFCGCGTTVSVAERLNRQWVGIDITTLAINLIKHRLRKQFRDLPMSSIVVDGLPKDLNGAKALSSKDPFEFQYWALDLVDAMPRQSKSGEKLRGADQGVDGTITIVKDIRKDDKVFGKLIVQVKGGGVQRSDIATLKGDAEREKADGGVLITLEEPTRPMRQEAIEAGSYSIPYAPGKEFPRIQILTVKDLLGGKRPEAPFSSWTEPYYKEAKRAERERPEWQQDLKFGSTAKPNPKRRKS